MPNGIQPTITNIFQFFTFISPFMLGFFLFVSSIFNQDVKGFVYIAGVLIATIINIIILNIIRHDRQYTASPLCSLLSFNFFGSGGNFDIPNFSSLFISFTLAYLILPMIYNKNVKMNFILITFIIALFIIDSITNLSNSCTNIAGIITGALLGFTLGSIWFLILYNSGNSGILYFNEFISNNVMCEKPSEQTFKCQVYKNGELIKSNYV